MLESIQIDLAVSECIVRGNVVRELYELKVDALVSQLFLGRGPQILVDAADYAELYGYSIAGIAVGCLCIIGSCAARAAAGGQRQGEGCCGQGQCDDSFELHWDYLRL